MRKFIATAITIAALVIVACGTAAYALMDRSQLAAPAMSTHDLSHQASHDGRALLPHHAPLFMT